MTAPPTEPTQPAPEDPGPRRLTRSGSDAIIGGVAGGLGRYFSIDPILFRIGFVMLSFFGGIGILAYLVLFAFVPSDGEERAGDTTRAAAIAGAVVLGVAVVTFLGPPFFVFGPGLLVLALVVVAGVLLWRALGGTAGGDPGRTVARIALAALLLVLVAGAAVGVGLAAALGGGVVIASLAVVAGLALIATAFLGGGRWLIVPALVLVLPLGLVAAADIDFDGGVGDREYRPASMGELRDRYQIGIGEVIVDLRELDLPTGTTEVAVDVGMGSAVVYVPEDVCVTSDMEIGAGGVDLLDRESFGLDVAVADAATAPAGRPRLHLAADVGIGVVEVVREGFFRDGFHRDGFDGRFGDDGELDGLEGGTNCS